MQTIPADRSSQTLRIMDAVAAGERILRAVDPSQLDATPRPWPTCSTRTAQNVGQFIERASDYLGTMLEHSDAFYNDLRLLGNVTPGQPPTPSPTWWPHCATATAPCAWSSSSAAPSTR